MAYWSRFSREIEAKKRDREGDLIYHKELAYMIMKNEKSQCLSWPPWRFRRANGQFQSEAKVQSESYRLKIQEWLIFQFQSEGKKRTDVLVHRLSSRRNYLLFRGESVFSFIEVFPGFDGVYPHWGRQSTLLSLLIPMLISSRTPSQIQPK